MVVIEMNQAQLESLNSMLVASRIVNLIYQRRGIHITAQVAYLHLTPRHGHQTTTRQHSALLKWQGATI